MLRLFWIVVSALAAGFREDWDKVGEMIVPVAFESVYLMIAQAMFLAPIFAMYFCMKRSRYFIPIFCTLGAGMAYDFVPWVISVMGFIPPVAIWACPSIRKWYNSLD